MATVGVKRLKLYEQESRAVATKTRDDVYCILRLLFTFAA